MDILVYYVHQNQLYSYSRMKVLERTKPDIFSKYPTFTQSEWISLERAANLLAEEEERDNYYLQLSLTTNKEAHYISHHYDKNSGTIQTTSILLNPYPTGLVIESMPQRLIEGSFKRV